MTYDHFLTRIEHADPFERLAALESISFEADDSTAARAASTLLADSDPGVREQAAHLLESLATIEAANLTVPYIASNNITVRNLAGEVLVKIGQPSITALASSIDDDDHDVRKFAIDVLAQLPAQELASRIAERLEDEDDNVVLAAVDALGDLGASQFGEALHALYERVPLARPGIVAALGAFGRDADLKLLEKALIDEDPVVQYSAAEALAKQEDPEVLALLLRKVGQVDPMARPVVLSSIVSFYESHVYLAEPLPESIKGLLIEMLDDMDVEYRCAAARGLRYFLDGETVSGLLKRAGQDDTLDVEMFKTLSTYPAVFGHIVQTVESGGISPQAAAGFVLGFLGRQVIMEYDYPEVAQFIQTHFSSFDAETKIAAINISSILQHPELQDVIRTGMVDPDMEVSGFAADAAYSVGLDPDQGGAEW